MNDYEKSREEERLRRGYSESYLSAMKRRLNLQSLGAYIRVGSDKEVMSNDSFRERNTAAFSELERILNEGHGEEEAEQFMEHITVYVAVVEEIYFSLGMKAGATLHCKLSDNFETDI